MGQNACEQESFVRGVDALQQSFVAQSSVFVAQHGWKELAELVKNKGENSGHDEQPQSLGGILGHFMFAMEKAIIWVEELVFQPNLILDEGQCQFVLS